ncbi:MAG: DUF2779 domain-containing protein [Ignavibacteriaceae bacterium]|nr:DUF2779 domain-containing protein [Ignavibacteriaceae bacterium]
MRYLTKSKFKLALECPTKLYYTGKKEYVNKNLEDEFLLNLAKGGFQVGELAKLYFPGGHNIDTLDHEAALELTKELLKNENVIIYEAAFQFNNLFVRTDILIKKGNNLDIIEVKAKSYDPNVDFLNAKGFVVSKWSSYLYDIAFQTYVINKALPGTKTSSFLMLADKTKYTSVDELNQKFYLKQENGRTKVELIGDCSMGALGDQILGQVPVNDIMEKIFSSTDNKEIKKESFEQLVNRFAENYEEDKIIYDKLSGKCKKCEFYSDVLQDNPPMKSGFHECWMNLASFSEKDFNKPMILDIWDFRQTDKFIDADKFFQENIVEKDLNPKSTDKSGLSRTDRQWLQIQKSVKNEMDPFIDIDGLKEEMSKWDYPLHFIDFETSAVAIPFNKGRRPYEQIAFQYSHHTVTDVGRIEHAGQWLNTKQGFFPNFDFLRELKKELENDLGTIFRYAAHENSILNAIYKQLQLSNEPDKDSLCAWIKTITKSTGKSEEEWEGKRNMVDMFELVKRFYYHISMKGSNSIKDVLPAILNTSIFLQNKYSKPIYGKDIISKNYTDQIWVTFDEKGKVENPYKKLPPIFQGIDGASLDGIFEDDEMGISEGGAAMAAYAKLQFTQINPTEKMAIENALLRYCELDTFAMVMIYEAWKNWVEN